MQCIERVWSIETGRPLLRDQMRESAQSTSGTLCLGVGTVFRGRAVFADKKLCLSLSTPAIAEHAGHTGGDARGDGDGFYVVTLRGLRFRGGGGSTRTEDPPCRLSRTIAAVAASFGLR